MEPIIIRKAAFSDLETLLSFEQGVIITERPFDDTLKPGLIHYYDIENMIAAPDVEFVVAELDHELVGCGYTRIENAKPYRKHTRHAYLGFMYVVPAQRGKGINKMIIDVLAAWAASQQINELRLDVYHNNEAAIKAYERAGFSSHMIAMRKGLK